MNLYHKRFLNSFASENVIGLFSRYKGAFKEITESWAMLEAFKAHIPRKKDQTIIVVGDGCSPRTGALFAYYTKGKVISVDPMFNMNHWEEHKKKQNDIGFPPQRLEINKCKIEEYLLISDTQVTIILPHSHAPIQECIKSVQAKETNIISMPCCEVIPSEYMKIPHLMYSDYNVLSPKNEIHIWLNIGKPTP